MRRSRTDFDLVEYPVGGDTQVTVVWNPWVYDENDDGVIEKAEAVEAMRDYCGGLITKEQAMDVLQLYFSP